MDPPEQRKDIVTRPSVPSQPPALIPLGPNLSLGVTGLTEEQQQALMIKAAEKAIDRADRDQRVVTDVGSLRESLDTMSRSTAEVIQGGGSVTVTNTRDDALGRTEIIMGTSDAAKAGKLTRTQTGRGPELLPWIIGAVVVGAAIIVAAILR